MRIFLYSCLLLALTGCSGFAKHFENEAACTLSGNELRMNSMYGPFGITAKIRQKDGDVACAAIQVQKAASK